jgi:quercetin dioxygenase-like cupin family protein
MPARPLRLRFWIAATAVTLLLCSATAVAWAVVRSASAPTVTRTELAEGKPRGAKDRTLGLSRVAIAPGAELALHHHEGTQIAFVQSGVLSYSVRAGSVKVREGAADQGPRLVRTIAAGQTGRIRAGQWIVEQPSTHHSAANNGDKPIVIYLATLLRHGAPPSTPG